MSTGIKTSWRTTSASLARHRLPRTHSVRLRGGLRTPIRARARLLATAIRWPLLGGPRRIWPGPGQRRHRRCRLRRRRLRIPKRRRLLPPVSAVERGKSAAMGRSPHAGAASRRACNALRSTGAAITTCREGGLRVRRRPPPPPKKKIKKIKIKIKTKNPIGSGALTFALSPAICCPSLPVMSSISKTESNGWRASSDRDAPMST